MITTLITSMHFNADFHERVQAANSRPEEVSNSPRMAKMAQVVALRVKEYYDTRTQE